MISSAARQSVGSDVPAEPGVVLPQSTYGVGHLAVFHRLVAELTSLGADVIEYPGPDRTDPTANPYFVSSDILTTVDCSPVTP